MYGAQLPFGLYPPSVGLLCPGQVRSAPSRCVIVVGNSSVTVGEDGSGTFCPPREATGGDSNRLENVHTVDKGGIDRGAPISDSYHAGGASHGTVLPASPLSACYDRNTCRQFLELLSSDPHYLNLLNLLDRAYVSRELMLPSSSDTFPGW